MVLKRLDTGILEEVSGFGRLTKKGLFSTIRPVELFVQKLSEIKDTAGRQFYTGIEVVDLDASMWIDVARPRTVLRKGFQLRYSQYRCSQAVVFRFDIDSQVGPS